MSKTEDIFQNCAEIHNENNSTIISVTDNSINIEKLHHTYALLKKIIRKKTLPFSMLLNNSGYRQTSRTIDVLEVMHLLEQIPDMFLQFRKLHPLITCFQQTLSRYDFYCRVYNGVITKVDSTNTAVMLNKLVSEYRDEVNKPAFRQELRKYQRNTVKNLKGVTHYIQHLFTRHARLLVIRLDLAWGKVHSGSITPEIAKQQRQQLLRNMKRNRIFRHVLGTVWKMEYGPDRGFHYHTLFFLDGNKSRCGINICEQFGKYWISLITEGKGTYFNCNARPERYEKPGVGMVKYDDILKQEGLQRAVEYLTKIDTFARLALPGNVRTFGRSEIKTCSPKGKRGRKRTQPS
ncbi:inovirus-type Gp2 protein [Salmonella enterica]|nr:inovirus Gp2 family protein [Salmonella enterica]EDQ7381669.1 inovirus Gp2 family protein [Salmonella enterica subsp. diarizonae serovar 35:l,v:z35]EBT2371813.1 inovirus Gp2 family protein [Salmonella enterica]ECK6278217.1 inovirus Gp2 family protein [Salmonella enterica]EDQ7909883.1 inovirus Gp2 family protein [Salmonella enterica]